jgi:AcrR family transcriptional regulator
MTEKTSKEKKFSRQGSDARRELLIRSALRCLEAEGYSGLSVRKITKEANVSQGMINLHFGSINQLIASAYDLMSHEFYQTTVEQLNNHQGSAADKLDLFFQNNFSERWMNPRLLRAWLVFWSLIPDSSEMSEAYKRNNQQVEAILKELLLEISRDDNLGITHISPVSQRLMSLLDGLWVRQALEQRENASEYALEIARNWLTRFRKGTNHD